jgi:type IV pilus assembly protein PilE
LMVVVAIIGIIAAIAFPSYTQYIVRANRSAAQSFMVTAGNREAMSQLNSNTYFAAANEAQWASNANMGIPADVVDHYTITVTADNAATPPTFTVTAVPKASQPDGECGSLTYDQAGTKGVSVSVDPVVVAKCWK